MGDFCDWFVHDYLKIRYILLWEWGVCVFAENLFYITSQLIEESVTEF